MTTATDSGAKRQLFVPTGWLLSRTADLSFLFGGALVSLGLFAAWQLGHLSPLWIVSIWIFVFHGPHFWGTMSRTYADRTEWPHRKKLFLGSLLWFLAGPALVLLGLGANQLVSEPYRSFDTIFFFLAALWAYQHVIKQHFGFVALYRARAREFDRRELHAHRYYLLVSMWMPAVMVLFSSPGWTPSNPIIPWISGLWNAETAKAVSDGIVATCYVAFWIVQGVAAIYLVRRIVTGRGINGPATSIALLSVALHWLFVRTALHGDAAILDNILSHTPEAAQDASVAVASVNTYFYAFVPLVTIYHNIQYHALIWFYNRGKYQQPGAAKRYGWAAHLNRNFGIYLVCGVVYTLLTIGIEHYGIDFAALAGSNDGKNVIAAAIWGWSFLHYYVDSKIWRVSVDEDLQRVLGFAKKA